MCRSLVLIPRQMSIPAAAHLLGLAKVSGAPVVDEEGRCIGVLSASDFLHFAEKGKVHAHAHAAESTVRAWQIFDDVKDDSREIVEDYMNCDPVTVPPGMSIGKLARMMIDAHIHRVIVVDENDHPIGIVSSIDILAAIAQADSQYSSN